MKRSAPGPAERRRPTEVVPDEGARQGLIPAERQARIVEFVRAAGVASIHRIAAEFHASPSTIRRDLDELTERGYLVRTHGGAVFQSHLRTTFEPSREIAQRISVRPKAAIGRHAAELVCAGQSVAFDSSSTVLEAARRIAAKDLAITAVTNDIEIARLLSGASAVKLIVPGGTLRPGSLTLTGEPGLALLASLRVDVALIGMHSAAGLKASDGSLEIVATKRALIEAARQPILLIDSTKFQSPSFCTVCPIERFDRVVTDDGLSGPIRDALERLGVALDIVPVGAEG